MTGLLEIDGSYGEGGGQTIRIATSFSIIFNRPIRVRRVRAGRRIPGLRPQHAATLGILRDVCGGSLQGGEIGSTEFTFVPGEMRDHSSMSLDLGTAASITLVLQALVPAVALSKASLDLELVGGGTDVPWSPTSDYVSLVLARAFREIGVEFELDVERRGYYPNGGGRARARISPCAEIKPIELSSRGLDVKVKVTSRAGMLPRRVPEQQVAAALSQLSRSGILADETQVGMEDSISPGSSIVVSGIGASCFMGADSIGVRGKPAIKVGAEAGGRFAKIFSTGACVDPHVADMLAPLLFLAERPSSFLTSDVTEHLRTSLHIAAQFVPTDYAVDQVQTGSWSISISPRR